MALNAEIGLHIPNLWVRVKLAHTALRQGDAAAREMLEDCARRFSEAGISIGVVYALEGLATQHIAQGRAMTMEQAIAEV